MPDLSHVNVVAGAVSRFTREVTGADVFRGAGREGEAAGAADTIKVLTTRNKQRLGMTILKSGVYICKLSQMWGVGG